MRSTSQNHKSQNEHVILLEVFVERVQLNNKVEPNLRAGGTGVDFQFLDNDPIALEELPKHCNPVCVKDSLHIGKTCLFSLTPPEIENAFNQFDLFIRVFKFKKCGVPLRQIVGIALVPLTTAFRDALKIAGDKKTDSSPGGYRGFRNSFPLFNVESGEEVGLIAVAIRLTCFGKYIQTDFQMNMDNKTIEYKANQAHYRLAYNKKLDPCPELCNQTKNMCPTPRTCGVQFNPPPPTLEPISSQMLDLKKSKSKKIGNNKGRGTKNNNTTKDVKAEEKDISQPAPCPPSCYTKEQHSKLWKGCPVSCPNIDDNANTGKFRDDPGTTPLCPIDYKYLKQPCNGANDYFSNMAQNYSNMDKRPEVGTYPCPGIGAQRIEVIESRGNQQNNDNNANVLPLQRPQIVEMRPGLAQSMPFRLNIGDGAVKGNNVYVTPPSGMLRDGTRYTEICDAKKECFFLRVGKNFQGTSSGQSNVDFHINAPIPQHLPEEVENSSRSQQYNLMDCPPGAVYLLGPLPAKSDKAKESKKIVKKNAKKGTKAKAK